MNEEAKTLPALYGLVLTGGASTRMGADKALLEYRGVPQMHATFRLLEGQVERCFISVREEQRQEPLRAALPQIVDRLESIGPAAGLLAAHAAYPDAAWLAVACDLPLLQASTLSALIVARDGDHAVVAYRSPRDGLPEPLCAIWEPAALGNLAKQAEGGRYRLRDILQPATTLLLPAPDSDVLDNVNTPQEHERLRFRNGQDA